MAPVQIKVVYVYYSAKRTRPFFITEEELLNFDFHSFKSRLPHIAKSTSAKALRLTMSDENLEVDYDFAFLFLHPIDVRLALRETDRPQFLAPNHEIFGLSMHILVNLVFIA